LFKPVLTYSGKIPMTNPDGRIQIAVSDQKEADMKAWIPKKVAGVRIPRKIRKAAARIPKPAVPLALAAIGTALVAGIFVGVKGIRTSG
jgi:hypothetical protein